MLKKLLTYIKLTVFNLFRNNVRILLTIAGISIGMMIFIIGNAAAESYIDSLNQNALFYDKQSYLLNGNRDDVNWLCDQFSESDIRVFDFSQRIPINIDYKYNRTTVNNSTILIGSGSHMLDSSICYYDEGYFATSCTLIYGRDMTIEDINNKSAVTVIEKSTAMFLFQKENAIGEFIPIKGVYGYHNIEVIGIISDLPISKKNNFSFNKQISKNENDEYMNKFHVYVPNSFLNLIAGNDTSSVYNVRVRDENKEKTDSFIAMLNVNMSQYKKLVAITSQQLLLNKAKSAENNIKGIMSICTMAMLFVSGFIILTIFLFSIKERVYEIGVRRAIGASSFDIIIQFICEGIILGATSAIISCVAAIQLCNIITFLFKNILFIDFSLKINLTILYAAAGVSLIQGILYSFFPALSASKTKPTEAIRWD